MMHAEGLRCLHMIETIVAINSSLFDLTFFFKHHCKRDRRVGALRLSSFLIVRIISLTESFVFNLRIDSKLSEHIAATSF